jgi:phosphate transport system protein
MDGDLDEAERVVADDDAVDALRHAVEDECLRVFGLPGLALPDLGFVGAAMRVAHELERSADLMVNVARSTWRLFPHRLHPTARHLVDRLGRQASVQLALVARHYERIGDHAVTIAGQVHVVVTGERARGGRRR